MEGFRYLLTMWRSSDFVISKGINFEFALLARKLSYSASSKVIARSKYNILPFIYSSWSRKKRSRCDAKVMYLHQDRDPKPHIVPFAFLSLSISLCKHSLKCSDHIEVFRSNHIAVCARFLSLYILLSSFHTTSGRLFLNNCMCWYRKEGQYSKFNIGPPVELISFIGWIAK